MNPDKLTAPAHREDALKDFAGYSNDVMGLLKLTNENLDVVSVDLSITGRQTAYDV